MMKHHVAYPGNLIQAVIGRRDVLDAVTVTDCHKARTSFCKSRVAWFKLVVGYKGT